MLLSILYRDTATTFLPTIPLRSRVSYICLLHLGHILLPSQNSCKFLSNCFRSVITTCVSCIATIKNLITNLEKCQKSHPEEFFFVFNFSSLILAQLFFLKVFLHYVCAHRKIGLSSKKCQLVSLFMECNSVCIFCVLVNSHHPIQTCEFPLHVS